MNITKEQIRIFITNFYTKVNKDELLSPIFNDSAKVNWEEHIPKLCQFWNSIMLKTREYHNNAYQAHVNLAKIVPIKPRHFEIWLKLFSEQAKIDLNPLAAEVIISRATNIAKSLKIGMLPATN